MATDEKTLWAHHADLANKAFEFWNRFLGLRMGAGNDQPLDPNAVKRFHKIVRAVSWVESKHGTAGRNQPARDPMQCGNPNDSWWRELIGLTGRQDVLTRAPGLPPLRASELPPAAEADSSFPAAARISALANKRRGHNGSDFVADHSFYWSLPYLIHRTNVTAGNKTYQCGRVSRQRLIDGAVAYNGGGDPQYRRKIIDALTLIGEIEEEAAQVAAALAEPAGRHPDLATMLRTVIRDLAAAAGPSDRPRDRLLFPNGIQRVRAGLSADGSAELEISGQAPPGAQTSEDAAAGADHAVLAGAAVTESIAPEPDFHEDPDVVEPEAVVPLAAVREPSGPVWVGRFPGSRSTADLTPGFRQAVEAFIGSMTAAHATVRISATFRPPERAYLMHYAWEIAREHKDSTQVPPMAGVNIEWAHRDAAGRVDRAASEQAAEEMVQGFRMKVKAALRGRHTERRAIDMSIAWSGALALADANGRLVTIGTIPRDGTNTELHAVGRSYGVIKLVSDSPHWSDDGH